MGVEGHGFRDPGNPGSVFVWYVQQFQANLVHAGVNQPDLPGYAVGYINFASFLIGTAVIDTYQFKLAIPGVHDPNDRTERPVSTLYSVNQLGPPTPSTRSLRVLPSND